MLRAPPNTEVETEKSKFETTSDAQRRANSLATALAKAMISLKKSHQHNGESINELFGTLSGEQLKDLILKQQHQPKLESTEKNTGFKDNSKHKQTSSFCRTTTPAWACQTTKSTYSNDVIDNLTLCLATSALRNAYHVHLQHLRKTTTHILFGAGSYKALGFVGALQELCVGRKALWYELLKDVRIVSGVSAGAIVATMCCLGVDPWQMESYALDFDAQSIKRQVDLDKAVRRFGLMPATGLLDCIRSLLEHFCQDPDITLAGLRARTNRTLRVYACDADNLDVLILDADKYPEVPVCRALQFSCALPGVFQANKLNGKLLVDGGLMQAVTLFDFPNPQHSLFFFVRHPPKQVAHALDFLSANLTMPMAAVHPILRRLPSHINRYFCITPINAEELDYMALLSGDLSLTAKTKVLQSGRSGVLQGSGGMLALCLVFSSFLGWCDNK